VTASGGAPFHCPRTDNAAKEDARYALLNLNGVRYAWRAEPGVGFGRGWNNVFSIHRDYELGASNFDNKALRAATCFKWLLQLSARLEKNARPRFAGKRVVSLPQEDKPSFFVPGRVSLCYRA